MCSYRTTSSSAPSSERETRLVGNPTWLSRESYNMVILVVSAMLYSIMACFVKLSVNEGISPTQLLFFRAAFQGSVVVISMCFFPAAEKDLLLIQQPFGTSKSRSIVIGRGFVGGVGFLLYFYTISVLPLGDATALLSLNPIVTVIVASIILKETIRRFHIVAVLGSVIGSILVARPNFLFGYDDDDQKGLASGYLTGLLGSCSGAGVYILVRKAGLAGVHTLQLLFSWSVFALLFSSLVGLALPWALGRENSFVVPDTYPASLYVSGVCVAGTCANLLLNYGVKNFPAGKASIIRTSSIVWSYALEVSVFHQIPQELTVLGVCLILSSLITISLLGHREEQTRSTSLPTSHSDDSGEETKDALGERLRLSEYSRGYGSADATTLTVPLASSVQPR